MRRRFGRPVSDEEENGDVYHEFNSNPMRLWGSPSARRLWIASLVVGVLLPLALAAGAGADQPGLSGSIAFETLHGLYLVSADGGTPLRIPGTRAGDGDPVFSADGTQIAFDRTEPGYVASVAVDVPRDIYVMRSDGTGLRRLTTNPSDDGWPTWSPSGRSIAFWSDRRTGGEYVVDVATGAARAVAFETGIPDWTPDGRLIFSDRDDEIATVRPYGAQYRVLSNQPGDVYEVHMSPAGTMLAYIRDYGIGLYVAAANGSGARPLVTSPTENPDDSVWSPDGAWIAYDAARKPQDYGDIWEIRPDGTDKARITSVGDACCPTWHR